MIKKKNCPDSLNYYTTEIWNHHRDENDRLEFHISLLRLSLKYHQNFLYRGKIIALCLWDLLWNQHQAMIVACHLYSVRIQYQYVYYLHYCLKDRHHYSSCCPVVIFVETVFVAAIVVGCAFDKEIFWKSFTCFFKMFFSLCSKAFCWWHSLTL